MACGALLGHLCNIIGSPQKGHDLHQDLARLPTKCFVWLVIHYAFTHPFSVWSDPIRKNHAPQCPHFAGSPGLKSCPAENEITDTDKVSNGWMSRISLPISWPMGHVILVPALIIRPSTDLVPCEPYLRLCKRGQLQVLPTPIPHQLYVQQ